MSILKDRLDKIEMETNCQLGVCQKSYSPPNKITQFSGHGDSVSLDHSQMCVSLNHRYATQH